MNRFVLDASVVLSWCFPDEIPKKLDVVTKLITSGDRAIVTAFWSHEVLNALLVGERRQRITAELMGIFLQDLKQLAVEVDFGTSQSNVFETVHSLCRKYRLSSYDAAYLEIAVRRNCPLATVDKDLAKAAQAEGLSLL